MPNPPQNSLTTQKLPDQVLQQICEAKAILEHRGLAEKLTELIGKPITASLKMIPAATEASIYSAVDKALEKALDVALSSLQEKGPGTKQPSLKSHKLLAGLSGAAGGALGGVTLAAELPLSTILILRSVAEIAQSQGEDLSDIESRLSCLSVFALDPNKSDDIKDDTDVGYLAVRIAMNSQIKNASEYLAKHGLASRAAPPLIQLLSKISERFGIVVTKKLAAQAIPVVGAAGGALINTYFMGHYQDLARAHFTIRRLERDHGETLIAEAYRQL